MSVEFRTEGEPAATRADYWEHAAAAAGLLLEGHPVDWAATSARMRVGEVGAVRIMEATTPPGVCVRSASLARRADPDSVQVDVLTHGRVVVHHLGRESSLKPGDLTVVDPRRPIRLVATAPGDTAPWLRRGVGHVTLLFPRGLVPQRDDELARLAGARIPGDRGTGALVSAFARQLPRHMDDAEGTTAIGARLGTAVIDLLSVALAARLDRGRAVEPDTRKRALLLRVHAFIEEQLGDPGLSPDVVAAAHHISTRYLHKLFQEQGATVAGWIRQRRLDRCRQDLIDPVLRFPTVASIARRWGFASAIHFTRVFRATFGVTPSEYRQRYGAAASDRAAANGSTPNGITADGITANGTGAGSDGAAANGSSPSGITASGTGVGSEGVGPAAPRMP